MRTALKKTIRTSAVLGMVATLSGCLALPPAIQVASLALDGYSYVNTGKSVTDHALSMVANRDCAMLRALEGSDICIDNGLDNINMDISVASGPHDESASEDEFKQLSEAWLTVNVEPVETNPEAETLASETSHDEQLTATLLTVGIDPVK